MKKKTTKQKPVVTVDEAFSPIPPPKTAAEKDALKKLQTQAEADAAAIAKANEYFDAETPEERKVVMMNITDLKPSPHNPREKVDADLAASIQRSNGVLEPLLVRPLADGFFQIITGHRRHKAAPKAGFTRVPCVVIDVDEVKALELNLSEQIQRKDLSPLEEANACENLRKLSGYSVKQVAATLSQSESWVRRHLSLATCAPEVKTALRDEKIRLGDAYALAALPTHKHQVQSLKPTVAAVASGKTTIETVGVLLAASNTRKLADASWKLGDSMVLPDVPACAKCPNNSSNNQQPGLFEAVKSPPTCTNGECFDDKAAATWNDGAKSLAEKYSAKVLSLDESERLYAHGELAHGSKYVEANKPAPEDRSKRTWLMLADKLADDWCTLKVFVASKQGKPVVLFLESELTKRIGEELGLKWAKPKPVETPVASPVERIEAAGAAIERELQADAERVVVRQVAKAIVEDIAKKGETLADARFGLENVEESDWEEFAELMERPVAEVKRIETDGTINMLRSFEFGRWLTAVPLGDLCELAESHGLNIDKMLEAQMNTARAEALMKKGA